MTALTEYRTSPPPPQKMENDQTQFRQFVRQFLNSRLAVAGLVVFVLMVLAAILAPLVAPQDPYDLNTLNIMNSFLPPRSEDFMGEYVFWLGSDGQGRDMLSGMLYGLRTSLTVGVGSAIIACMFGASMGLMAGFFGGRFDALVMRLVDLHLSFPTILIAMMILAFLGPGLVNVVVAIIVVEWAYYARTVRATALVENQREYMEAADSLVLGRARKVFRHLLPNCLPPLIVIATIQVARAISLEATLSFLGLGVPITEPSLGLLISNGYEQVIAGRYWISVYPGVALLILIVSINLVGDHLREILNPSNQR
ncbi:ABC transporter permease [Roseitranquillus sediminis]|uniref:ABC transporter permease n=1 Tax=Roseitranquillus sediminis TaxID=2809051 RepID=UPI001D0BFCD0|nr:ABC transporter permease [Roseitranquillus sediminis]MBM9594718.1 ABC transporter permease [Roseitranquillus sediminis]